MLTDTNPAPNGGSGLSRSPPTTTVYVDVRRRLSDVQERPRRPGNLHRGEGIHVYRRVPATGPPARLHQYGRGGHYPLSLARRGSASVLD